MALFWTTHTAARWHQMHWKTVALVLQPQQGIPLPPMVPEVRQVRRAPLRRADFEQFGNTDCRPGLRKVVVNSRMEATLATTTEGHTRLERARERFAQFAEEPGGVSAQETLP